MKVVLFCGGLGLRIRDAEDIPKPMVHIGYRPILWHVMKYYAHFGHTDFILCLGHRAEAVKNYFLNYDECISNDFVLSNGGENLRLLSTDIHDWKITFAETGVHSNIGQRLKAVEKYLEGEEMFLANYADGLVDLPLTRLVEFAQNHGKIATFVSARPNLSYHVVSADRDGTVSAVTPIQEIDLRINAGYFVFRRDIFRNIRHGEELVLDPFRRLVQKKELMAYRHDGFFGAMDTFKDKQLLDGMYARGEAPWEVWKTHSSEQDVAVPVAEPGADRRR